MQGGDGRNSALVSCHVSCLVLGITDCMHKKGKKIYGMQT